MTLAFNDVFDSQSFQSTVDKYDVECNLTMSGIVHHSQASQYLELIQSHCIINCTDRCFLTSSFHFLFQEDYDD